MSRINSEPEVLGIQESFKYMHQLMFFLRRNYIVVTLPVIGFKKRMDQSEIENKSGIFSTLSSDVFISQNYSRVQIKCEIVEISLYLAENNKYFK